jgi:hypothetical protein
MDTQTQAPAYTRANRAMRFNALKRLLETRLSNERTFTNDQLNELIQLIESYLEES